MADRLQVERMGALENGPVRVTRSLAAAFSRYAQALALDHLEEEEAKEWLRGAILGNYLHESLVAEFSGREAREAELTRYLGWRADQLTGITAGIRSAVK